MGGVLLATTVVGCTGPAPEPAPDRGPRPDYDAAPLAAAPITALPRDLTSRPWSRTRLPRRVPTDTIGLARLVDDPPGRVTLVYHPPERWDEPVDGWASETLLLHGLDGRWRVLAMDDLGLPEDSWPGPDTYGAGSLSPDGQWWAGKSRAGVVLLDLRSARAHTIPMGTRWTAWVEWRSDSRSLVVGHGLGGQHTVLLRLPGTRRVELPFRYYRAAFDPAGRAISVRVRRDDELEIHEWRGDRTRLRGVVEVSGLRPDRRARDFTWPELTDGRLLTSVQRASDRGLDLVVVDSDRFVVEARLRLDRRARRQYVGADWLGQRTVLLRAGPGLVAWSPDHASFLRVTVLPDPANGFSDVAVATDLAGGRTAGWVGETPRDTPGPVRRPSFSWSP